MLLSFQGDNVSLFQRTCTMTLDSNYLNSIEVTPLMNTLRLQKISDAEYFSSKFGGYISNSRLSLINPNQDNDPKAFFEGLSKHNKYSDALIFGRILIVKLFHVYLFLTDFSLHLRVQIK